MPSRSIVLRSFTFVALGLVVFGLCHVSAHYFQGPAGVSLVWPANAVVLAFTLRLSQGPADRRLTLVVAWFAMVCANLSVGRAWDIGLLFPVVNMVEVALAAWIMRGVRMPLIGLRALGRFLVGAVVIAPLAATLLAGAVMAILVGLSGQVLMSQAGHWFMADLMGMAIVAPFALSLTSVNRKGWKRAFATPVAIGVVAFLLCWQIEAPVLFLAFPLVALAVINDRDRGGALGIGAVAIAVVLAAQLGQGPIARLTDYGQPVSLMAVFLCSLVLTAYPLSAILKRLDHLAALLDERREVAERTSAAKSELIGRVGQELRTPLTGVVTVAEILRSGHLGGLNERQRDMLARVAESGAEIETLSREMIALADGGLDLADRSAGVAQVVTKAVAAAHFKARRRKVAIEVLAGESNWRVRVDADRLYRLIMAHLVATLDITQPGGRVRLVVGLDGETRVRLTIEDSGVEALATRMEHSAAALSPGNDADPFALDRADLVGLGGDLLFSPGALGGGRLMILLPRATGDREQRAA
jgi:signal transduction histidine kinase